MLKDEANSLDSVRFKAACNSAEDLAASLVSGDIDRNLEPAAGRGF